MGSFLRRSALYSTEIVAAEALLKRQLDAPVRLTFRELVAGSVEDGMAVIRCAVSGTDALPDTVVVKRRWDQDDRLRREAASLEFLSGYEETRPIFPVFHGCEPQSGIMVIEDLGDRPGQWLGALLFTRGSQDGEQALFGFQRAVGRMHAATCGETEAFGAAFARHGAHSHTPDRTDSLAEKLRLFSHRIDELGFRSAPGLADDVENALVLLENPGPFLAFVHGDTTLANTFWTPDGIRLFDLESGGMRHALTDGAFSRIR